jgi:hypothetical protein
MLGLGGRAYRRSEARCQCCRAALVLSRLVCVPERFGTRPSPYDFVESLTMGAQWASHCCVRNQSELWRQIEGVESLGTVAWCVRRALLL